MQKEKWLIQAKKADFYAIGEKYGFSPVIARIIRNRNVIEEKDMDLYLNGTIEEMDSPWLMKDMDKAVDIINIKINQNNKIRIISDYDIDGICSGFILSDALKNLEADVDIVVPHRIEDGYGMNEQLIEKAYADGVDTIITCDNGIAAFDAVERGKTFGMTIIITDHHEIPFEEKDDKVEYILPKADAIINQKQPDCEYPFKELCGAMVAYKFIEALYESRGFSKMSVRKYIEYAAIATIGDVVDLKGENRIVTKYGLSLLRKTRNIGLNELIYICGLEKEQIKAFHIGFVIGPCLNATGRLDTAAKAIELFACKDIKKAKRLATELKKLNDERKAITEQETVKACKIALEYIEDKVLVIFLEECHESIAGIIAGRVREKFNKPVLVLTNAENGVKGSGRSIEEYDMFLELSKVKELFTKFGGHKMAAGLSLKKENVTVLRKRLNELCTLTEEDLIPKVWIDTELPPEYITYDFIEQLNKIEPFGKGNEKPVFAAKNIRIRNMRILGKEGNVLKFDFISEQGTLITGICFNKTQEFIQFVNEKFGNDEIKKASRGKNNNILINVVYYPTVNVYNGRSTLQMIVDRFC